MNDHRTRFTQGIARQEARKLKAQRQKHKLVWLGFSVTGIVGWGIVILSLLGLGAGLYLDAHRPGQMRWTLTLFALGLLLGCVNAWHWIHRETENIRKDQEEET